MRLNQAEFAHLVTRFVTCSRIPGHGRRENRIEWLDTGLQGEPMEDVAARTEQSLPLANDLRINACVHAKPPHRDSRRERNRRPQPRVAESAHRGTATPAVTGALGHRRWSGCRRSLAWPSGVSPLARKHPTAGGLPRVLPIKRQGPPGLRDPIDDGTGVS